MALGTVKFFDDEHSYGFITLDGSSEDLPAHRSDFGSSDLKTLTAGQRVSFDIVEGDQGKVPTNIQAA
jgi:CspA family cold shock protein